MEVAKTDHFQSGTVCRLSYFRGQCFRWGVGFWVALWLFSILVDSWVFVAVQGYTCMEFGTSSGSITFETRGIVGYSKMACDGHFMWWGYGSSIKEYPSDLIGEFGHFSMQSRFYNILSLPVALFLWIWLAGGWHHELLSASWSKFRSSGKLIAKFAILISLPVVLYCSNHKWRIINETSQCYASMRSIQLAASAHWGMNNMDVGTRTPWEEIFKNYVGPELKKCPSGDEYILSPEVPPRGLGKVVECPNPEHQRRLKIHNISYW